MPVGRLSSSSRNDGQRYSASNNSLYREDRHNGMYRSSPDLAVPSYNHRRSSSTDSLDGSYRGSHSRQSSDSCDGYPTRNLSTRRVSSSAADPLQFIKSKGAEDLAKQAEEQIKQVEEIKKAKTVVTETVAKDEDDWQSSLGDWKSRRKSKSEAFLIKEEMEEEMKRKEEEERNKNTKTQKSFKQIQEEREKRKSAGNIHSFYPFVEEDEGDNDDEAFISPIKSSTSEKTNSSFSQITSSTPSSSSKKKSDVAAWAQGSDTESHSDNEYQGDNNNNQSESKIKDSSDQSDNLHNVSHNNNNKDYSKSESVNIATRVSGIRNSTGKREEAKPNNSDAKTNKINNIRNKFESTEDKPVSRTKVLDAKVDLQQRKNKFENLSQSNDTERNRTPRPHPRERGNINLNNSTTTSSSVTSSAVYSSNKESGKDYVEKTVKISGKHRSGGFGFSISGGVDIKQNIIVDKVSLGSAADICELKCKDEILSIDKHDVSSLTNTQVTDLIQEAAQKGQIEIRVKRCLDNNEDDSEEFLSTDEDEEEDKYSREKTESLDSTTSQEEQSRYNEINQETNNNNNNNINKDNNIPDDFSFSQQPLLHQLTNDPSLILPNDIQNDSSYQSADTINQSYSSYTSSQNASSLDNSDNTPPVYASTAKTYGIQNGSEPIKTESTGYTRTRASHHDYVNTTNIDSWSKNLHGDDNHDNHEPQVVLRRKKTQDSVNSSSSFDDTDRVKSPDVGSSDSDGPPAILRKWQRQRPKSEYQFQDEKPLINQKRLSATLPWQPDHLGIDDRPDDPVLERASRDFNETVKNQPVPVSQDPVEFNYRSDRRRMREWNKQQEQLRQSVSEGDKQLNTNTEQVEFEKTREELQRQYEEEQEKAAEIQKQKQQKEREMLEPEMSRMSQLEERRKERRRRLQELHQDATAPVKISDTTYTDEQSPVNTETRPTPSHDVHQYSRPINNQETIIETRSSVAYSKPKDHTYQNVYEPNYVNQPSGQLSTMNIQVASGRPVVPGNQPSQSDNSSMAFALPGSQSGGLIIDPRNRLDENEPIPQYTMQLNLNKRETQQGLIIQPELRTVPEQEKEKIRQEYEKFEETFRKQQEEEDRRFREREEQLRQQEERLRAEEERLRREEQKLEEDRKNFLNRSADFSKPDVQAHQPVQTKIRGQSPVYRSTISATPIRKEPRPQSSFSTSMVIDNAKHGRHNVQRVENAWPPPQKTLHPGNISVRHSQENWHPSGNLSPRSPNSANRQGEGVQSLKSRFIEPVHNPNRNSLSREDMLAMNRKATPLQTKPDGVTSPTSPTSTGPVKREMPTRQEIHHLNAVPKPKIRQPVDWIASADNVGPPKPAPRRSEMMKNQYSNPQDHWLIEEAERRRMNSDINLKSSNMPIQPGPYNGPIKPPRDSGNVWTDGAPRISTNQRIDPNMPKQIRQTLLQKTAGARGSNGSNYSQELNNNSVPQITRNPYMSQTMPSYNRGFNSPRDYPSQRPPSSHNSMEQGSISGKKLCSSCDLELGFGAAMIIEELGLYYHMACFKCCVCGIPLGNGIEGADVRIRGNKLHCPNCYSNDEGISSRG